MQAWCVSGQENANMCAYVWVPHLQRLLSTPEMLGVKGETYPPLPPPPHTQVSACKHQKARLTREPEQGLKVYREKGL